MGLRVAYGRVSTQQQADHGALERQERALLEGTDADEVILDVGSGKSTSRPGYQRLLELIAAGQVDQVLVADQDRLNRNLQADLELWGLCDANGTRITDLSGREIEFRSPDGELLSTVISALNQHRSRAYGAKTRRGLEQARQQGLPARPRVAFGFRKVRNEQGRLIGYEPDPETAPLARERIDWFLSGKGLTGTCRLIGENHPRDTWMQPSQLKRWLKNPTLTGRVCWHKKGNSGEFSHVEPKSSFQGLISDTEAEQIHSLIEALSTAKARAGRPARTLSGIAICADCKKTLSYKLSGRRTWYLRCSNPYCEHYNRCIRADKVMNVLKASVALHCRHIAPMLTQPEVEPPEAYELRSEIKILRQIKGTEALINQKENEIQALLQSRNNYAEDLMIAALADLSFWDQPEEQLNSRLREFVKLAQVQFAPTVKESVVWAIEMKTPKAPFAPVLKGLQNEVIYQMPGGIYWRRHEDGTRTVIATYRLPELFRESTKFLEVMASLPDYEPEQIRAMSPAQRTELMKTCELCESALPFGIDMSDPDIEHEDVIWEEIIWQAKAS